jgi:hypothetical protein
MVPGQGVSPDAIDEVYGGKDENESVEGMNE